MSRREGEFHNEVHTERVPLRVRDPERVQFAYRSLPYRFCSKAEVTGADVSSDIPRYLGPPVKTLNLTVEYVFQLEAYI